MKKDTFTLRKTFLKPIENLSDAQRGRLFRAIYQYQCGLKPELTDDIAVYFAYFEAEFEEEENKRRIRAEKAAERRRKKLEEAKAAKGNDVQSEKPETPKKEIEADNSSARATEAKRMEHIESLLSVYGLRVKNDSKKSQKRSDKPACQRDISLGT